MSGGNRGWVFGIKVLVSESSYGDSGGRATLCASISQNWIPAFVPTQADILACGKIPLSPYTPMTSIMPRKMYPWRSGTRDSFERVETQRCFSAIVRRLLSLFLVPLSIYIFAIKLGFISFYSNTNSSL